MTITAAVARQLAHPAGFVGGVVARLMNLNNRAMNAGLVAVLALDPAADVLEIGFGGGDCLRRLLRAVPRGRVSGVDLSPGMVERARRRLGPAVRDGRLRLEVGDIERLPFPDARFDAVITCNTIYFWAHPDAALGEVLRVLRPGGTFALGFRPRSAMLRSGFQEHGFTLWSEDEVTDLLQSAGLAAVGMRPARDLTGMFVVATGRTPDAGG